MRRLEILEEPLSVVFGNIIFTKRFRPEKYRLGRRWYGAELVDLFAKLLYPAVMDAPDKKESIAGGFSEEAIALCKSALSASDFLNKAKRGN